MVEYGNGVGEIGGQVSGGSGGFGGAGGDWGAQIVQIGTNAVHAVATMPPAELFVLVVAVVIGLIVLKRAL